MPDVAALLDKFNLRIPCGRWSLVQLFSNNISWIIPPPVQSIKHNAFSARWTRRIPFLQALSSAEIAADIVESCLAKLPDEQTSDWSIIDFNSGSGEPVPTIERIVNNRSKPIRRQRQKVIPFILTSTNPNVNLDAWMDHASQSQNLSFVPQPVSAANPPFAVISATTRGDKEAAFQQGFESDGRKVIRLFCSTFHHFDDEVAVQVLRSSMETSDAFVIIEMQERTVLGIWDALLEGVIFLLLAVFWFWIDWVLLFFTYCMPMLPLTKTVDGVVSCLQTRTFAETIGLVERAAAGPSKESVTRTQHDGAVRINNWEFREQRVLRTWPIGYLTAMSGIYISP